MLKRFFGFGKGKEERTAPADCLHPDIDVSMSYCPTCGDEYRAGIEQCYVCKVPLISGEEKLAHLQAEEARQVKRSMEIDQGDQLVSIRSGKLRDLKPFQVLLARHTIPALLTGEAGCAKG